MLAMNPFLAPESWPFVVAVMLLGAIAVSEGLALLVGFSLFGWLDNLIPDFDHDLGGPADLWLAWLQVGRVPLLVVLVILLTAFATIGFAANALTYGVLGHYLPVYLSSLLAFLGALPVVRSMATKFARLIPRDESSAVSLDSLIGQIAVVINGTARADYPAQARVISEHGQTFYVHVEPEAENEQFNAGESVLLVKQISGARFKAIANPSPDLL